MKTTQRLTHTLRLVAAIAITLLTLNGCSRNNGDIGPYFGTWHAGTVSLDGDDASDVSVFLQFQSGTVRLCTRSTRHPYTTGEVYGNWSEQDKMLSLDFDVSEYPTAVTPLGPCSAVWRVFYYNTDLAEFAATPPTHTLTRWHVTIKGGNMTLTRDDHRAVLSLTHQP